MSDTRGDLAHVVHPADKMNEVLRGTKSRVKSLCGSFVKRAATPGAPVCRVCFEATMALTVEEAANTGTGARGVEDVETSLV